MRDIQQMQIVDIDITNVCNLKCSNCTRLIGHFERSQEFFMDIDTFERSLVSVKNFPNFIGIIGGETTLHPQFTDICRIIRNHRLSHKSILFSNGKGPQYDRYSSLIRNTFVNVVINKDRTKLFHSPILVSSKSAIEDIDERTDLIDNCWVQNYWSATINPKGAFFCEVAGALSMLYDGPNGIDISTDWWKRPLEDFKYQIDWACQLCGACLSIKPRRADESIDDMSNDHHELLKDKSQKIKHNLFKIYEGDTDPLINVEKNHVCWYSRHKQS